MQERRKLKMHPSEIDVNEILFRCSSLGYLMTESRSKSEVLSETTKTHLTDVFVSAKYNRHREIHAKQLDKGNETEEDSITVLSRLTKKFFKKNTEHLSNEFIKGTPDLFEGESIQNATHIRDTKSSWDAYSFFRAKHKDLEKNYYWQGQGYMWLTGAKHCSIDYVLNNTPWGLIESELRKESYNHPENDTPSWIEAQIIANHVYDQKTFHDYLNFRGISESKEHVLSIILGFVEIPLKDRHFNFEFERNDSDLEMLKAKIMHSRIYIKNNLLK